jgi:glycosyltransferase involved in cell wall biosynthesis
MRHGLPEAAHLMRIALVVSGGVDRSGRERVTPALLWLIERLASRHELVVYVLRYHDRAYTYPLLGATIHDLGSPKGLMRQLTSLVRRMRRDGPFDVVHGYFALPPGLLAAMAGRCLGVPSVVTYDSGEFVALPDIDYGLQLRRRHRLGVALTAHLATRLTVCSHYQEQLARAHGLAPAVIPIGVETRRFTLAGSHGAFAGGIDAPPWRLLHVASLNRVKDQTTLLEALQHVEAAHLDIVGEDTLGGAIGDVSRRLGLRNRVTLHGFQPTDALASLYRRAHLFVLSSRHEAANVAVLEAAACGLASVGTHVGYLADWSPDRAVTVAPRDPAALAQAINDLLADPAKRQRLASAARGWTLAHDADWTARQFETLYSQL